MFLIYFHSKLIFIRFLFSVLCFFCSSFLLLTFIFLFLFVFLLLYPFSYSNFPYSILLCSHCQVIKVDYTRDRNKEGRSSNNIHDFENDDGTYVRTCLFYIIVYTFFASSARVLFQYVLKQSKL